MGCSKDNSLDNTNINKIKYIEEALDEHNKLREIHKSKPLKNNKTLNEIAQKYALKLFNSQYFYSNYTFNGEALGENIFLKNEYKKPKEICQEWYNEKDNYDYDNEKFQKDSIHFTQLVWKSTEEFGFGYIYNNDKNKTCGVALYYPSGNRLFEFKNNVEKKKK